MAKSSAKKSKKQQQHQQSKKKIEEEEVDYAEAADAQADDEDDEEHVEQESDEAEDDSSEGENDDSLSDEDSSSEEEEEDGDDVNALFKGSTAPGDKGSDEESSDEEEEENEAPVAPIRNGRDGCTFDLRNLTAMNTHQIPANSLFKKNKAEIGRLTIELPSGHTEFQLDEEYLLQQASAGCAQLLSEIWQLPTETSDAGPLATLPGYDEVTLPRAMPPPPPKEETKWEKFAKAKGIPLNKEKRSRKVWDEATGTWMYRHGYEKANSGSKEWPIMEVGANDDPFDDPWEKQRDAKRARSEKNLENKMKNQERVGNLAKGTTNRILKSREKSRDAGKLGGNADRDNIPPVGVPVDLKGEAGQPKLRGKASTSAALEAVQRSTASLGKFDRMREGEPERKKILSKMKKRKYELATDKTVVNNEGQKSMKILDAVINGGGMAKERAIRKGQLAKGETAYDYEYNDGLGASSFKKKKGRAGAGKMKKMTKKRAK